MARAQNTDFLHLMRFTVTVDGPPGAGQPTLDRPDRPGTGFVSVQLPNIMVNADPYKEGQMIYTQKYPGNPTVGQAILTRGVARLDSSFWNWMRVIIEGLGEYRADLTVNHYHRDGALVREYPGVGIANLPGIAVDKPAKVYHLYNAFPSTYDIITAALDAQTDTIALASITLEVESFEIEEVAAS